MLEIDDKKINTTGKNLLMKKYITPEAFAGAAVARFIQRQKKRIISEIDRLKTDHDNFEEFDNFPNVTWHTDKDGKRYNEFYIRFPSVTITVDNWWYEPEAVLSINSPRPFEMRTRLTLPNELGQHISQKSLIDLSNDIDLLLCKMMVFYKEHTLERLEGEKNERILAKTAQAALNSISPDWRVTNMRKVTQQYWELTIFCHYKIAQGNFGGCSMIYRLKTEDFTMEKLRRVFATVKKVEELNKDPNACFIRLEGSPSKIPLSQRKQQ